MKILRLFISSPGDVGRERHATAEIIRRLQSEFAEHCTLDPYFWEWEPVDFSKDYQANIPSTADFDIVICILWSRLGSRLSDQHKLPPDYTRPASSGTEYELLQALHGQQQHPDRLPDLLVWKNDSPPPPASAPPLSREEEDERIRQRRALQDFLTSVTKDAATGSFIAALNSYQYLDQFEELMEGKLRKLIQKHIGQRTVKPKPQWQGSPFRDLDVFEFEHAPIFFGRSRAVGEVVRLLQSTLSKPQPCHFALILGASGSGKSSLARAGVLPLLTRPGVIEGIGLWRCAIVRPSDDSADLFQALAAALLSADKKMTDKKTASDFSVCHFFVSNHQPPALPELADPESPNPQDTLAAELRAHPQTVAIRVKDQLHAVAKAHQTQQRHALEAQITSLTQEGRQADAALKQQALQSLQEPKARLVLLLDQMEELFTLNYAPEQLRAFLETIDVLARSGRVFVIGTLRSDFYPRYQEQPTLVALARDGAPFDLLPPTPDEISQIIRRPASLAALQFEPHPTTAEHTLADTLRDEALADTEALPLLEHVLNRLYQAQLPRADGRLTFADYEEICGVDVDPKTGIKTSRGVGGALGKHAEDIFTGQNLKPTDPPPPWTEDTFRAVFRCLVTFGKGEGDTDVPNRRAFTYQDLIQSDPAAQALVDTFIHERLLIADTDAQSRPIVRLSHEALLTRWPRLSQWLQTAPVRDFISMRRRLIESERQWREQKRNADCLLPSGLLLEEGRQLLKDHSTALTPEEKEFIRESSEHHEARQREALELETRRRKEAERLQAEAERQRRLALRFAAVVFVMVIVAVMSSFVARAARILAEQREHSAKAMVFLMKADQAGDPEAALAFTRAAVLEQSTEETRSALLKRIMQAPLNFSWLQKVDGGGVIALAWNRNSSSLAIGVRNGAIYLAKADGSVTTLAEGHGQLDHLDGVLDLAFTDDDGVIVALHESGMVRRYSRHASAKPWEGRVASDFLVLGAVSPDAGRMALAGTEVSMVETRKLPSDVPLRPESLSLPGGAEPACFRFSQNSTKLAIGQGSGGVCVQVKGHFNECRAADGNNVLCAGWHADSVLALGVMKRGVEVWDLATTPRLTAQTPITDGNVTSLDWKPAGDVLAGATNKRIRLWKMKGGEEAVNELVELPFVSNHQSTINSVRWAPHGEGLASGDDLGVVKMWSTQQTGPVCFIETGRPLHGLDMSADHQWIAVGTENGQVQLWNAATQSLHHEFAMGNATVNCIAWRPGGSNFACADDKGQIQFFDSPKGAAKAVPGHEGTIWQMAWSPDGRLLFSTGNDGMVRAWDHAAGTSKVIQKNQDGSAGLAVSPDSSRVAIGSVSGQLSVVRVADGVQESSQKIHADSIGSISWSQDGRRVASAGNDGMVAICDAQGGNPVCLTNPNSVEEDKKYLEAVAFSPDGARIAAAGQDGRLFVWDTADGSLQWQVALHGKAVYQLRWVTEDTLLSASADGKIARLDTRENRWLERAADMTHHLPAVSSAEAPLTPKPLSTANKPQ